MLITIISWLFMLLVFFTLGITIEKIFYHVFKYEVKYFSSCIMIGVVFATIYAETVSIFTNVGSFAVNTIAIISLIGSIIFRKDIRKRIEYFGLNIKKNKEKYISILMVSLGVIIFGSYIASRTPEGYDTLNYHIPSIRWLEEYGAVKGLGNLHTRFAYNSSFLCLQALFSFSWLYESSLHSVNGFIWTFMVIKAFSSLWWLQDRKFQLSDLLRIIFLVILFRYDELCNVCTPNTDFMPMCLVAYIFIEWCALVEDNEKSYVPYGLLGILGLFSVSVKLSAAALALFVVKPCIMIIRQRKFTELIKFGILGIIVVLPYVLRNIIISGYILYPIASLDFFDFDWEIPKSVVASDNVAIKCFARVWGTNWSYYDIQKSFIEWFEIWIQKAESYFDILAIFNNILLLIISIVLVFMAIKKKKMKFDLSMIVISMVGYIVLIGSAPSIRFGRWWFYIIPAITIYISFSKLYGEKTNYQRKVIKRQWYFAITAFFIILLMGFQASFLLSEKESMSILVKPNEYIEGGDSGQYIVMNGIRFYFSNPNEFGANSLNGYDGFPGTESLATLNRIEMRSFTLKDGFKVKEEYKNVPYDFQGYLIENQLLSVLGLNRTYMDDINVEFEKDIGVYFSPQIPEEEISQYNIIENDLDFYIDSDITYENKHVVTGWAYVVSKSADAEYGEIAICVGDKYYLCTETIREDVRVHFGFEGNKVGFSAITKEEPLGEICIIDRFNKVIYR